MKRTVLTALILSLLAGSVAMADGRDNQKDRDRGRDDHTSRDWQDNDSRDGRRDWRTDDWRDGIATDLVLEVLNDYFY